MTVDEVLDLIEERTERFRATYYDSATTIRVRAYYEGIVDVLEGLHGDIAIAHYEDGDGGDDCRS